MQHTMRSNSKPHIPPQIEGQTQPVRMPYQSQIFAKPIVTVEHFKDYNVKQYEVNLNCHNQQHQQSVKHNNITVQQIQTQAMSEQNRRMNSVMKSPPNEQKSFEENQQNMKHIPPSIHPVSQQSLQHHKTQSSRLAESSINAIRSLQTNISGIDERKSFKNYKEMKIQKTYTEQKENIHPHQHQTQPIVFMGKDAGYKEKYVQILNILQDLKNDQPSTLQAVSQINTLITNLLNFHQQVICKQKLNESCQTWKTRCLELEQKSDSQISKENEYNKLRSIMESLQSKVTVLVDENSKVQTQKLNNISNQLNQQVLSQKSQLDQANYEQTNSYEYRKRDVSSQQITEMNLQITNLNREKEELSQKLSYERRSFQQEKEYLQGKMDQLNRQIEKDILTKQEHHTNSTVSIISERTNQREFTCKLEQAELKILTLQISNDNLKQELQHKDLDKQTITNLKDKISILETKIQELITEKDKMIQEIDNQSNQISLRSSQIKELQNNMKQMENTINQKQREITSLNSQLIENETLYKENINKEKGQNQQRIEQLKSEMTHIQQTYSQKQQEAYCEKQKLEQDIKYFQEQLQRETKQREDLEYEKSKIKESLQKELSMIQEQCSLLYSQKESLTIQYDNEKNHSIRLKSDIEVIKQQKIEIEKNNQFEIFQLKDSLNNQIQQLQSENSGLRSKYQILIQEIGEMKERLESRKQDENNKSFIRDKHQLEQQIVNLTEKNKESESLVVNLEHRFRNNDMKLTHQSREIEQLKTDLEISRKQNAELNHQIQFLAQQLDVLQQERDDLKWKQDTKLQEIQKYQKELGYKNEQLDEINRKYQESQINVDRMEKKLLERMEFEVRSETKNERYNITRY